MRDYSNSPCSHLPNFDSFITTGRDQEVSGWYKGHATDIVIVAMESLSTLEGSKVP